MSIGTIEAASGGSELSDPGEDQALDTCQPGTPEGLPSVKTAWRLLNPGPGLRSLPRCPPQPPRGGQDRFAWVSGTARDFFLTCLQWPSASAGKQAQFCRP